MQLWHHPHLDCAYAGSCVTMRSQQCLRECSKTWAHFKHCELFVAGGSIFLFITLKTKVCHLRWLKCFPLHVSSLSPLADKAFIVLVAMCVKGWSFWTLHPRVHICPCGGCVHVCPCEEPLEAYLYTFMCITWARYACTHNIYIYIYMH